jgi:signal transduction histidine kinase
MEDGACTEVALIGREGMVGLAGVLGTREATTSAVVRVAGDALRVPIGVLRRERLRLPSLRAVLDLYTEARLIQVAQTAACNRLHSVEARLARWLLVRTPLNAIVGWVQMLQHGDMVSPDRVAHAIEVIGRNARLQTQLIEDILDVTRIVTGKLDIERRPLLLSQLLETVLTGFLPAADAKRVALSRQIPNDLPPMGTAACRPSPSAPSPDRKTATER